MTDLIDFGFAHRPTAFGPNALEGKCAIITGGSGGFGRAIACLFARLGAQVILAARNEDRLGIVAQEVAAIGGPAPKTVKINIRDPQAANAAVELLFEQSRPDILINNAGGQFAQDALDFSHKGWLAVIDTNLNGTWWMTQAVAGQWRLRDIHGSIVNIVMPVARGIPQMAHSAAARAGVIALTKSISTEWAPLHIRVNCVSAGTIAGEGMENYDPDVTLRLARTNPMMRLGDPWDIAQACAYLSSQAGAFITGEVLTVDGGLQQWGTTWPAGAPDYFSDGSSQ